MPSMLFPGIFFGYFVMSKKEKSVKHKFYIVASIAAAALIMGMFIQYILRDEGFYHFNKDSFDNRLMRLTRWEPVDAYDNSMFLVSLIPHNIDYLYGKSLYSLLVNPIPRKLWPGKPTDFGLFMASLRDSSYIKGLAGSLTGESYANFGIAGVVLIFLIFGSAVRLFHQIYARHRDNNFVILIYSAGLISICFMQIRGQLLTVNTQFIYLIFVPLYLGLLF